MGTKDQPGRFDCYAHAEGDEPIFVLLGRDPHAATLVRQWAQMALSDPEQPAEKATEALSVAAAMDKYRIMLNHKPMPLIVSADD